MYFYCLYFYVNSYKYFQYFVSHIHVSSMLHITLSMLPFLFHLPFVIHLPVVGCCVAMYQNLWSRLFVLCRSAATFNFINYSIFSCFIVLHSRTFFTGCLCVNRWCISVRPFFCLSVLQNEGFDCSGHFNQFWLVDWLIFIWKMKCSGLKQFAQEFRHLRALCKIFHKRRETSPLVDANAFYVGSAICQPCGFITAPSR